MSATPPLSGLEVIATDTPGVYAFRIGPSVDQPAMHHMAEIMNGAFDTHDTVSMLLIFDGFSADDAPSGTDWEQIKANLRALTNVARYATVGAPEGAETMIETFAFFIPTKAETFAAHEEDKAWAFVGARPA
ncbi:STAS/SEC14 domain-containing protein [Rhodobacteraceae bacterium CCMM004]|nr:STAS/SEC14 domain-containing protein [Rhodobacteraceae bacterium CCMM004]